MSDRVTREPVDAAEVIILADNSVDILHEWR